MTTQPRRHEGLAQTWRSLLVADVLKHWVAYAGRRKALRAELIAENVTAVEDFTPGFQDGMADEDRAGPAKQIALELQRAQVDLTDGAAVQRFIGARNAELATGSRSRRRRR